MKTLTATAALTIMFLSAVAFAGSDLSAPPLAKAHAANVTVITKNGQWPAKGQISPGACAIRRCMDA